MNVPRPKTSLSITRKKQLEEADLNRIKDYKVSKAKEFPSYKNIPRYNHVSQAVIDPSHRSVKQPMRNSQPTLQPYAV